MDLSLVPLEELHKEFLARFDHAVVIGIKILPNEKKISRRWNGDHHIVAGLCADVGQMVIKEWYDRQTPIQIDDF